MATLIQKPFGTVFILALLVASCARSQNENKNTALKVEDYAEVIRFINGTVTLEGTLQAPMKSVVDKQKTTLVVFVHGSGRATRLDYAGFAESLLTAGFAVFRYDKRGVGKSGGVFQEVGTWNSEEKIRLLATDAVAAIVQLRKIPWIDASNVIVAGGSQAGWIIPVVASMTVVSATVCLSGPVVSVGEEIYYSEFAENGRLEQGEADKLLKSYNGDRGFDNVSYLARMSMPSLWIFGGKDVSIPVTRCIERFDSVKAVHDLPADKKIYPDADHGLYNSTKQKENYEAFIIEWLRRHRQ